MSKIKINLRKIFFTRKNLGRDALIILVVSLAAGVSVVKAGNLDSPGTPAATGYALSDIYTRLTTNATATEGDHNFSPASDPASSFYTLKQIYDAIPTINANEVKSGTELLGVTGTLTPDGGTATASGLFSGLTANLSSDWNLDSGTLNLACNTATFDGTSNLVADAYDGAGSGANRWCMTNSGDAVSGDILSGKSAWVDGVLVSGSMANVGAEIITPGTSAQAISEGFHNGSGSVSGDADLTEGNIKSGVTIFGVSGNATVYAFGDDDASKVAGTATTPGTLLLDQFNGSAGGNVSDNSFYTLEKGGVDDYNNNGSMPSDSYSNSFTQCDSGNSYCGTDDAAACSGGICYQDDATGLVWSDYLDFGTDHTWFWANNCFDPGTAENSGTCVNNGDDACQCVKKLSAKTGCESFGDGNWSLPYQKELMQVYINGSWGNLPHAGSNFWSATTSSTNTQSAWRVTLGNGYTASNTKTTVLDSRCVRR